jgi:hypothetical protein
LTVDSFQEKSYRKHPFLTNLRPESDVCTPVGVNFPFQNERHKTSKEQPNHENQQQKTSKSPLPYFPSP